jgi:hypothetical protein
MELGYGSTRHGGGEGFSTWWNRHFGSVDFTTFAADRGGSFTTHETSAIQYAVIISPNLRTNYAFRLVVWNSVHLGIMLSTIQHIVLCSRYEKRARDSA